MLKFRSLQRRLLGPIILTAILAAALVAFVSYWLGTRWAKNEMQARFHAIRQTLSDANFPLNAMVLDSLAELTRTELIALDETHTILVSTIEVARLPHEGEQVIVDGNRYRKFSFSTIRGKARSDGVTTVVALFDEQLLDAVRRRAMLLPLATGISTIIALSTITLLLTSRLVGRIGRLQRRVELVAHGDFESTASDDVDDELGRLSGAVDSMAKQLAQLWKQLNRQRSEKLLHQVASGMAHQLRNSLTGARMAVELHAAECTTADDEGIRIAIHQLELSEDYVRRILLVASGRQDEDRPMAVAVCWDDILASISSIAKHLRVDIEWIALEAMHRWQVKDGPTWIAAVTNLIQNAIQAGDHVQVALSLLEGDLIRVRVSDNGPGVPASVADEIFEPFVTSKPEGMGLGLPVVRRAAEYLGGSVHWSRESNRTVFEFDALVNLR